MSFGLENLAQSREEEINLALEAAKKAKSERSQAAALQVLTGKLADIRESMSSLLVENVTVDNFDEVRAALRNEMNRISKPIISAIESLKVPADKIERIKADIERKNFLALNESHDIQIVKKPKSRIVVDNFHDLELPTSINVENLSEIEQYFAKLSDVIKSTFNINVPPPQVTVNPPDVVVPEINIPDIVIPEAKVNIPKLDISEFTKAIKTLKDVIRKSSAKQDKQMTSFSGGLTESAARKAFKQALAGDTTTTKAISVGVAGAKALTDNTAGVALDADTACSYVDVTCYGGLISLGDSTSTRVDASANGIVLTPGSTTYRVYCTNLNQVFASGATGSRACFIYYV